MPRNTSDVLIVGGGLAGLACGVTLADRGLRVTLLERDVRLGGRACSWTHAQTGDRVDIGPHVILSEYSNFLAFLERLGSAGLVSWQPRKVMTIGTSRGPLELRHWPLVPPLSLLPSFLRMPGLAFRDHWSNNRPTLQAMRFGEERIGALDPIAGIEYLRAAGVTEPMIDRFWKFACMAVMNTPLERVSTAALMRVHGRMIGYRRVHFGFPAIGLGDLYAEDARKAIEAAGGTVQLRTMVTELNRTREGHEAICDDMTYAAPHCVVAVPPQEAGELLPGIADTAAFEPSPYVSTYLWFDRSITRERFWALLWSPSRMYYDFYDLANIRPEWRGRPSLVGCNFICSHRAAAMSDDDLVAAALREIAEFAPAVGEAKLRHADVHRIPMAIPLPLAGTERKRPGTRTSTEGLFLAGDWTRTALPSTMDSAVRSGYLAAEAVLEARGRPENIARTPRETHGLSRLVRLLTAGTKWP